MKLTFEGVTIGITQQTQMANVRLHEHTYTYMCAHTQHTITHMRSYIHTHTRTHTTHIHILPTYLERPLTNP